MCGIAGIYHLHQPARQAELETLAARLAHRGPNDRGYHLSGRAGLAQTRLSIIDLSGGHQPMVDTETGVSLVANGEIYNYVELGAHLTAEGARFDTHSDSEIALRGYLLHGTDYVRRLHGMFAYALHDPRSGELVLARDRLGIKPLYYARLPDRLIFASELKALLPLLPKRPEVEPIALLQYLQSQFNTGRSTIVRGVERLLPGEQLIVASDLTLRHERYWSAREVQTRPRSFEEAAEEFQPLFDQVMTEHLRSDVPYGIFLSGGVDSAVLLAMLDRLQHQPIRSFSVGYRDSSMSDELSDAQRIAEHFGTRHTELRLGREEVFAQLPATVWAADDLMRDYASLPTILLARAAAQELKVVFTGEGGDEVFAGYGRYRRNLPERLLKNLLRPGSGGFRTRGHWRRPWPNKLFGPELAALGQQWREPVIRAWKEAPKGWSDVQRCQYVDLTTNLVDDLLVKADRMLMAHGLEGRVPFLDHRIVEFGLSLPDVLKVGDGQGKLFLKRWAEQYLPSDHLWRRKRGFHVPMGEWLTGPYLETLAARLKASAGVRRWFNSEAIDTACAAQRAGGHATRELVGLLQFAIWHRLFIEGDGACPDPSQDPLEVIA